MPGKRKIQLKVQKVVPEAIANWSTDLDHLCVLAVLMWAEHFYHMAFFESVVENYTSQG